MIDKYNRGFERLIGKKIVAIDTTCANCVMIETEEGKRFVIDTEPVVCGLYSPVLNDIEGYSFN